MHRGPERSTRCSASGALVAIAWRPRVCVEKPRLVREHHGLDAIAKVELPYHQLPDPVRQVGAALDSNTFHPGRSAAQHLRIIATAAGLPRHRVDEVLGLTGLADVAGRRVGGFSLGMRQRLSLAGALLGDPGVLVFDEPLNGLDPDGIRWLRGLLRELAAQNRTVFVSSHLLSEVAQTVDEVVVLSRGRLVAQTPLADLVDRSQDLESLFFDLVSQDPPNQETAA